MNSSRDPFLFRKYLKRLVPPTQGLIRYTEFLSIDEATPATALRTLASHMKREFEDDYLGKIHTELATRMYEAWKITAKEDALRTMDRIRGKFTLTDKLKTFVWWSERVAGGRTRKIKNPFSAFYDNKYANRTNSTSAPKVLTPTLLPTAVSIPSTLQQETASMETPDPVLEPFYQEHSRHRDLQNPRYKPGTQVDSRFYSSSPSAATSYAKTPVPVFDRLSADTRSFSSKSLTTAEREVRKCSFTPHLTSKQYFSIGSSPSTLYSQSELVQRKIRQMQLESQRKEMSNCSFSPQIRSAGVSRSSSFTTSTSNKSVFEKLFEGHDRSQRRLREKAMLKAEEEVKSTPFRPKVNHPVAGFSPSTGERLFQDSKVRERKIAKLREYYSPVERQKINGSVGRKGDLPAHERLYAMQKAWNGKQSILKTKVMKEEGVTFSPHVSKT